MKKAYLIILDGYGLDSHKTGNAVELADAPYLHRILDEYPHVHLKTYGNAVGLPEFQTGGSEVGHITIGAGRAVKALLTKISDAIDDGSFFENEKLKSLMKTAKEKNRIHLLGMTSDGGIHSFQPHVYGLMQMAKNYGIEHIFLHCMLDGRDVGERTAKEYLHQIDEKKMGIIASLGGRFYGMDRDNNAERTQKAIDVLFADDAMTCPNSWQEYIDEYYTASHESDYYIPPVRCTKNAKINADDVVIFWNYRSDRARQLSAEIAKKIQNNHFGIFGPYCETALEIFKFEETSIKNTLGEVVANAERNQLRISETEKFNHVTFYFSGERKKEFNGEERILIASPKCKSYAEKPEMSAYEQTEALMNAMNTKDYALIIQNYANADLVGHSGNLEATKKAIHVLNECVEKIVPFAMEKGYEVFITADHGNADHMINSDGSADASHTKAPVPFVWMNKNAKAKTQNGTLQDIAPTLLSVMGLNIPDEMTGSVVFEGL